MIEKEFIVDILIIYIAILNLIIGGNVFFLIGSHQNGKIVDKSDRTYKLITFDNNKNQQ